MKLILTDHPARLGEEVTRACQLVCPATAPAFVPIVPAVNSRPHKCVINARAEEAGRRGYCVLAQFIGHAVVCREQQMTCVTPDLHGARRILFLADDSVQFDSADPMARMPMRHVPFDRDPSVARFISVIEQQHAIRSVHPPTSGSITISRSEAQVLGQLQAEMTELIRRIALRKLGDNDRCVCNSKRPFGDNAAREPCLQLELANRPLIAIVVRRHEHLTRQSISCGCTQLPEPR